MGTLVTVAAVVAYIAATRAQSDMHAIAEREVRAAVAIAPPPPAAVEELAEPAPKKKARAAKPEKTIEKAIESDDRRFALVAKRYAPSATIDVRFPSFVVSTPANRAWLAIAEVGKPQPPPESWVLVQNGARRVTLRAPAQPGTYEVRLYGSTLEHAIRFVVEKEPA
jgi:hypothetical protein